MSGVGKTHDLSLTGEWTENQPPCRKKRRESSWQCEICQRSFGRIEHLRRHVNSHQMERCFQCDHCKKAFSRSDTLRRHQLTHQAGDTLPKTRGVCACRTCASAKTRCSGDLPCKRCSTKGTECVYSVPDLTSTDLDSSAYHDEQDISTPGHVTVPVDPDLTPQMASVGQGSELSLPENWNQHSNWLFDTDSPTSPLDFTTLDASIHLNTDGVTSSKVSGTSPDRGVRSPMLNCGSVASGRYYVDGNAARLPRITAHPNARKKSTSGLDFILNHRRQELSFPQSERLICDLTSRSPAFLTDDDYEKICHKYALLCASSSPYHAIFRSAVPPSREKMNDFIQICLESFQPLIPILHVPSLDLTGQWLLSLTLAATGSSFVESGDDGNYSYALNEFARRAILASEVKETDGISDVVLKQIKLCNCIGLMYDGDKNSQNNARLRLYELASSARQIVAANPPLDVTEHSVHSRWQRWIWQETRLRTWYAIWLIDAMWSYQFQTPRILKLEHANLPLPCQEVLWEAESSVQWQHVVEYSPHSPTLIDAIQSIYVQKGLQSTMGEYSRIILVHGLYHRNWEVGDYLGQQLSAWLPSATTPGQGPGLQAPAWLPQHPVFSRWRNATCDCLDILHWSANSVVGAASGLEHPTILHLHLARVILLTPIHDIQRLASMVSEGAHMEGDTKIDELQRSIKRWAVEDAYKARLAMIHAGALLWHVRRYSAKGFHEGSAVFMATLALWAYGKFGIIRSETRSDEPRDEEEEHPDEDPCPITINLDRPADDELVQTFIRKGHLMQAFLNGVGEIRGPQGPKKVLREGLKIIEKSRRWSSNRNLESLLRRLDTIEL